MKEGNINKNLITAKIDKKDEFYTQYEDIDKELQHYVDHFKDKVVYCNCDDYERSCFVQYFYDNFQRLKLKQLIATGYNPDGAGVFYKYDGKQTFIGTVEGDGDYRSEGCLFYLKEADIVVTNPPFSRFRDFVDLLIEYDKKFLIIGNHNAVTCKNIFPLLRDRVIWLGTRSNSAMEFLLPDEYPQYTRIDEYGNKYACVSSISWFTNLEHGKKNPPMVLTETYEEGKYRKYDNYDAIEVPRINLIPKDYQGVMGVPITILSKLCPEQFEVIGVTDTFDRCEAMERIRTSVTQRDRCFIDGRRLYARVMIKKR